MEPRCNEQPRCGRWVILRGHIKGQIKHKKGFNLLSSSLSRPPQRLINGFSFIWNHLFDHVVVHTYYGNPFSAATSPNGFLESHYNPSNWLSIYSGNLSTYYTIPFIYWSIRSTNRKEVERTQEQTSICDIICPYKRVPVVIFPDCHKCDCIAIYPFICLFCVINSNGYPFPPNNPPRKEA